MYNRAMTLYIKLIDSAKQWHEQGHYKEAVILAQTGAELFTEQTFGELYRRRDIQYLQPQIQRLLFNNYSLGSDKVVSLYEALSGDDLRAQPFWSTFKQHTELRNDIVHQGREATEADAKHSIAVVEELIGHISHLL
jgi:hypothetical protein